MGVTIKTAENGGYWVNDKYVYKDTNDNWIAEIELTPGETMALMQYHSGDTE